MHMEKSEKSLADGNKAQSTAHTTFARSHCMGGEAWFLLVQKGCRRTQSTGIDSCHRCKMTRPGAPLKFLSLCALSFDLGLGMAMVLSMGF